MHFKFINKPSIAQKEDYHKAVDYLVNQFINLEGLKGIFQFGNINTPGISDIDLLVVFEDNVHCDFNPFASYPTEYRRLFTHGIEGMSMQFFANSSYLSFWQNYQCLYNNGVEENFKNHFKSADQKELKKQIALEFIATNYMDLTVQKSYRIIKLRSLLQHIKGLAYDLDFLKLNNIAINREINKVKEWIKEWFIHTPTEQEIEDWFIGFYPLFESFVREIFHAHPIYLPKQVFYKFSRNITVKDGSQVSWSKKGMVLPSVPLLNDKKKFNLLHRFNRFSFSFPVTHHAPCEAAKKRIEFSLSMQQYNRKYLPRFHALTTRFIQCLAHP